MPTDTINNMSYKELPEASVALLRSEEQYVSSVEDMNPSDFHGNSEYKQTHRGRFWGPWSYCCLIVFNFALLASTILLYHENTQLASPLPPWPTTIYSPAESAVEYETVVFDTNLRADIVSGKRNIYLDLTDEGDAAWERLTEEFATSGITRSQASRLPFDTVASPEHPEKYMTGLSVFHQLHCLNRIRKLLHPERYPWKLAPNLSELETHIHDNHCVDLIRQALMCNADISPIKWEMNAKLGIPLPSAKTVHTCKKWDSLMDWAADHKM